MGHLKLETRLYDSSDDDFVSFLFQISDSYGFLLPSQMKIFGVEVTNSLFVLDFLDLFQFTLLKL